MQQRLYSWIEIKRLCGILLRVNLQRAVAKKIITPVLKDEILELIARETCVWDIYPEKIPAEIPDPSEVKAAIQARLAKSKELVVQLPDAQEDPVFHSTDEVITMAKALPSSIMVARLRGQNIPDAILDSLLSTHKIVGCATAADGTVSLGGFNGPVDKAHLKESLLDNKEFMDSSIILAFQREGLADEDNQPYVLCTTGDGDEQTPTIVAFISGDLSEYAKTDSSFRPETHAAEAIREPVFNAYKSSDFDLKKTFDQLDTSNFLRDSFTKMMLGSEGTISLFSGNNELIHYTVAGDTSFKDYDWGSITFDPTAVEEKKTTGLVGRGKNMLQKVVGGAKTDDKKATTKPGENPDEILELRVPTMFPNQAARKKWFEHRVPTGGPLPKGWETARIISCRRGDATQQFMADWIDQNKNKLVGLRDAMDKGTDTSNHHIPVEPIPVLSPEVKENLLGLIKSTAFKEAVDRASQEMSDPKKWAEAEKKIPTLTDQLGIGSLDETKFWLFPELVKIAKQSAEASAILSFNLRSEMFKYRELADGLLKEVDELKKELEKNSTKGTTVTVTPDKKDGDGKAATTATNKSTVKSLPGSRRAM